MWDRIRCLLVVARCLTFTLTLHYTKPGGTCEAPVVYLVSIALVSAFQCQCYVAREGDSGQDRRCSFWLAYCPCIAHGYNLRYGIRQQKLAVDSGAWLLFRYNPALKEEGKNPLSLDCKEPSVDIEEYMYREIRFRSLRDAHPDRAERFLKQARVEAKEKYSYFKYLADRG